MANAWFSKGLESFLGGDSDYDANTVKVVCVDHADDTPVPATDDNLDDILAAARVATSGALASKTKTNGRADAADVTLSAVSGDAFESLVVYKDSGAEATSTLWVYIDTGTGIPCTPNGGDITIAWHANGIFDL